METFLALIVVIAFVVIYTKLQNNGIASATRNYEQSIQKFSNEQLLDEWENCQKLLTKYGGERIYYNNKKISGLITTISAETADINEKITKGKIEKIEKILNEKCPKEFQAKKEAYYRNLSMKLQVRQEFNAKYNKPQERSIVKDAVIGSVIAGPAGAVVGAINAADKNNQIRSNTNTSTGNRSVVRDAVVGGIIAGPAGAVVGSISAADKNAKNRAEK